MTDPVDKTVLLQALEDVISNMNNVTGMTMIMTDNTLTMQQYIDAYDPVSPSARPESFE